MKEKKKVYELLTEEQINECVNIIVKVSKGFELDDKEMQKLNVALMLFDFNIPDDLKGYVAMAKKYYLINRDRNSH